MEPEQRPVTDETVYCRLCGRQLQNDLAATNSRQCCLNATPIAGICPEHGPLGPHHATDSLTDSA
ncbi:hypothetical protein ACFQL4_10540 [Halosimplex aquaticum]